MKRIERFGSTLRNMRCLITVQHCGVLYGIVSLLQISAGFLLSLTSLTPLMPLIPFLLPAARQTILPRL